MYLIRDNKIIEFRGDRMPLSYHDNMSGFSSQEIKVRPDDLIYLFTDGFVDQFGGQRKKKFLRTQFKEVLLQHHKKPLTEQKQLMLDTYYSWRGNAEQVDDITIVGLKL
jgi:serine phosphatase RsbU (regulator of sigma subunit)